MRIEPTGVPPVAPKTVGGAPRAGATGAGTDAPAAAGDSGEAFVPSSDLAALLSAVRQTPEVRTEIIEAAAAQLAAGAFATPEAAADAAQNLLASGDLNPQP